jgi:signal transduction histidine kinase
MEEENPYRIAAPHANGSSERLATIGELAAGVAHEINNPVAYVRSNLESLDEYLRDVVSVLRLYARMEGVLPEDDPVRQELRELKERVDLDYLTDDMLDIVAECREGMGLVSEIVTALKDFSKQANQEISRVDINDLLDKAMRLTHNELKYHAQVQRDFGDLPLVRCRPGRLSQVFINLLVNAAQAIEGSGRVTVLTRSIAEGRVRVELADTGKGISPDELERVFEPFYTTKEAGRGTGLGLSVAREIVSEHGGQIHAETPDQGGTRFVIELPVDGVPGEAR